MEAVPGSVQFNQDANICLPCHGQVPEQIVKFFEFGRFLRDFGPKPANRIDVRESAESPRPMRRTSGNSPRSPGRLKASVPASKSASGRARTDLSDGIDIAVDQNAEPTDWDDALAEFLLHFVRTRPRALDKTGGDQDDNGSRQ